MKSINSKLAPALGALLCVTAAASVRALPPHVHVVPLAGITNDRDTSVSYLKLMVGQRDAVRGIYVETRVAGKSADTGNSGEGIRNGAFWLKDIESGDGVVLGKGQGVKAILLQGTIDSRAGKGHLTIKYLANGLLMHYRQCKVGLKKSGGHKWELVNAYDGKRITDIKVKTWWLGISTLQNVCPAPAANSHA
ncbi:MAG TPA: hypothetical protein VKA76_09890 [Gammaproteobacteria bacterium]|nr:hypothetical protein [Gammaproteobacteria bacterium]